MPGAVARPCGLYWEHSGRVCSNGRAVPDSGASGHPWDEPAHRLSERGQRHERTRMDDHLRVIVATHAVVMECPGSG